jgi:tRNA(fMet)-specific endonuclease VapC
MNKAVLDTDTLSAIMRQEATALSQAHAYLSSYSQLTVSIITRFEILRGLNAKNATSQLVAFDVMCQSMEVLPLTDTVVVRAAGIYGKLHQTGQLIGDADILIAAICLDNGCEIVTNNTSHFSRIPGLVVQNWLAA